MATKKRRQYGTGSVYQRSDGRWIGAFQAGWNANGTMRRITVSCNAEKGEVECKRLLRNKMRQVEQNGLPSADVSRRATVKDWATEWLTITQRHLRPKSWQTDRSLINVWVIPTIGHRRLDQLTPGDIRAVTNAIRNAGLANSTAIRARAVMKKMLKDAAIEGHQVPTNALMVSAPAKSISDRDSIDFEDAIALLKAAAGHADGSRWVAALLQAMRPGECLGLCWPLIDFTERQMDVSWQLQSLPYISGRSGPLRVPDGYEYRQLDGALCLVRPKTEKGQRIIPIVPFMYDSLIRWREISPPSPHGLVWPRPDGRPRTSAADRAAWIALQDEAQVAKLDGKSGRRYDLYEARHTAATLLLESGADPIVVKSIMGHSSIVTSRIYQHVNQAMARKALDGIAERLQLTAAPSALEGVAAD